MVISVVLFTGCTSIPYKDLNLDTTSNFKSPTEGKAGIYVYQWIYDWKGGSSLVDATFEIKGQPKLSLNTGEYAYIELTPGDYEYNMNNFLSDTYIPVKLEANQNYFFKAIWDYGSKVFLIRDQDDINEAKENIITGRYELNTVD